MTERARKYAACAICKQCIAGTMRCVTRTDNWCESCWEKMNRENGGMYSNALAVTRGYAIHQYVMAMQQSTGYCYMIEVGSSDDPDEWAENHPVYTKVGYSRGNESARLQAVKTHCPHEILQTRWYPGGRSVERMLHDELHEFRMNHDRTTEWFALSIDDILDYTEIDDAELAMELAIKIEPEAMPA